MRAEAKRCTSTKPSPLPMSLFLSTKYRNSSCSITGTTGRVRINERNSTRFLMLPQANSPTIKGWDTTSVSRRSFSSREYPFRKCSTQTDVSTRTISGLNPSARYGLQPLFRTAEFSESFAVLSGYKRLKAETYQGGLFPDAG